MSFRARLVATLLLISSPADTDEMVDAFRGLAADLRHAVTANLATLSLLEARPGMPDPAPHRQKVSALRGRLEREEGSR